MATWLRRPSIGCSVADVRDVDNGLRLLSPGGVDLGSYRAADGFPHQSRVPPARLRQRVKRVVDRVLDGAAEELAFGVRLGNAEQRHRRILKHLAGIRNDARNRDDARKA